MTCFEMEEFSSLYLTKDWSDPASCFKFIEMPFEGKEEIEYALVLSSNPKLFLSMSAFDRRIELGHVDSQEIKAIDIQPVQNNYEVF